MESSFLISSLCLPAHELFALFGPEDDNREVRA